MIHNEIYNRINYRFNAENDTFPVVSFGVMEYPDTSGAVVPKLDGSIILYGNATNANSTKYRTIAVNVYDESATKIKSIEAQIAPSSTQNFNAIISVQAFVRYTINISADADISNYTMNAQSYIEPNGTAFFSN